MLNLYISQMQVIPGQPSVNTKNIIYEIENAKNNNADIIVFPAMAVSGIMLGHSAYQPSFIDECEQCLQDIIAASSNIAVIIESFNTLSARQLFILQNQKFCNSYTLPGFISLTIKKRKIKLFCISNIDIKTFSVPADINDTDFVLFIDSSPYYQGKNSQYHSFCASFSAKLNLPLFYVNNIGIQNTGKTIYTFNGASSVYSKNGMLLSLLPEFEQKYHITDLDSINNLPPIKYTPTDNIASIYNAIFFGVKSFLSSIGIKKIVIGISGGIDSAVAAALYTKILSPQNVYLINLPSIYNSSTTKNLAKNLAENLKSHYSVFPIQNSINLTVSELEKTPINYNGHIHYLTVSSFIKENIQARDRSSRILAAIAACIGGAFTCNANKAEMTIGYSTLYGDNAGCLAATADLWKYQIYELADYINTEVYKAEIIPKDIMKIIPCAELSNEQNVDAGKGDPIIYEYHDFLFRAFTERKPSITPLELLKWYLNGTLDKELGCKSDLSACLFPSPDLFINDLEYWWRLFTGIAVAKRIQSPPLIAVSRAPFGDNYPEAQNGTYFTNKYLELKSMALQNTKSPAD